METTARPPAYCWVMKSLILVALVSSISVAMSALPANAATRIVVEAEDPDVDDYGPGGYIYPLEPYFLRRGVFDLKRFRVRDGGDNWVFEVEVDRPIDEPIEVRATRARYVRFEGEVFFQNFDIYIRTPDGGPSAQVFDRSVPGRNFRFARGHEWNHAVVITPYPSHVATLLTDWPAAKATHLPRFVQRIGPRFFVRVPKSKFGPSDPRTWRFAVTVSGALPLVQDYLRADDDYPNALTMPIRPQPGPEQFGGGDATRYSPAIIDLLAPTREQQKAALAGPPTGQRSSFVELKLEQLGANKDALKRATR